MVDVSLRHRRSHRPWLAPAAAVAVFAAIVGLGSALHLALESYRDREALFGLSADPELVSLVVAGERLSIPANTLRVPATRRGGPVERVDLALHWPSLGGYSADLADDFAAETPMAPIVFASIAPRESALDATDRLDALYAQFFTGPALPGPAGLVGRHLKSDSGYGGEIVYFAPGVPRPFVARCPADTRSEVPATCMRDFNFGRSLSFLYRFNRVQLTDWQALDARLRAFAQASLAR